MSSLKKRLFCQSLLLLSSLWSCYAFTYNNLCYRKYDSDSCTRSAKSFLPKVLHSTANDETTNGKDEDYPRVTGITLKMAFDNSDIWGVADNAETKSERFTSPTSLDLVHRLRRVSDCVLVGRGTVERDDCTLTVRRVPLLRDENGEENSQPVRVVIDPNLTLLGGGKDDEYSYALLQDGLATIIYHSTGTNEKVQTCGKNDMVTLVDVSSESGNQISSMSIIDDLASRNINHVMVEGGPVTALSFLREKTVDRAILIRAPVTFQEPVPSNMSVKTLKDAGLEKLGVSESDGDVVEYWTRDGLPWPTGDDLEAWP